MNWLISLLTRIFGWSTGAPKGHRYISVEKMLKAIERKSAHTAGAGFWTPTDAELEAAAKGSFSLRDFVKKILNQGSLGSCTAFGWAGAFALAHALKTGTASWLSTLYIYYYERLPNGNVDQDSGAEVVDGANVLSTRGAPLESDYPYNDDGVAFKKEPPASLDAAAAKHKILNPLRVSPLVAHIKAALKAQHPVIFGFMVYESFESSATSRTGIVTMPEEGESMVGGHCTFAIGYTDGEGKAHFHKKSDAVRFSVLSWLSRASHSLRLSSGLTAFSVTPPPNCMIGVNSWGRSWGDGGIFYMPWDYVQKYAADFYIFTDLTTS